MKLLIIGKEGRFVNNSHKEDLDMIDIVYASPFADAKEILDVAQDADFILVDAMGAVPGEAILQMPNLKMIHSEGVGYQYVDVKTATEKGVFVCNCKGMNSTPVAEHAIMLMIGLLKDIVNGNCDVLSGRQIEKKENYMLQGSLRELADCNIGIVGFGDIGRETARLASAFGAKCFYYNRSEVPDEKRNGAEPLSLDELLSISDFISLSVPVTEQTRGLANADFFAKMKEGAFVINTARGEIINSEDLINAIAEGHIAGAGLDCIEGEPVTLDNLFLKAPENVKEKIIFTPHIAGITASSFRRGYGMVWENIKHIMNDERPVRIVNGL